MSVDTMLQVIRIAKASGQDISHILISPKMYINLMMHPPDEFDGNQVEGVQIYIPTDINDTTVPYTESSFKLVLKEIEK